MLTVETRVRVVFNHEKGFRKTRNDDTCRVTRIRRRGKFPNTPLPSPGTGKRYPKLSFTPPPRVVFFTGRTELSFLTPQVDSGADVLGRLAALSTDDGVTSRSRVVSRRHFHSDGNRNEARDKTHSTFSGSRRNRRPRPSLRTVTFAEIHVAINAIGVRFVRLERVRPRTCQPGPCALVDVVPRFLLETSVSESTPVRPNERANGRGRTRCF